MLKMKNPEDEKFEYCWGSLKNQIFRGGVHEKAIYMGGFCKKGGLDSFAGLRGGGLAKKREIFLGDFIHLVNYQCLLH